jgi:hypothetical protein
MDDNIVQGNPTKTFFIEMITRDISIKDAILDLLDNSIDGASRINPDDYSGLFINITVNKDGFSVEDNCGGFSLDTAKKYAFRFGRPDDALAIKNSVGRFGIGMKRALFKMGKEFEVESRTDADHFEITVNVAEWRTKKRTIKQQDDTTVEIEDWDFRYENVDAANSNLRQNGTFIRVGDLYEEVSGLFDTPTFISGLRSDIEKLLNFSLEKKIKIKLNGESMAAKNIQIFNESSKPYYYEGQKDGVNIRVVAGLGEVGDPAKSGWYIYCNDRLVVEADRTELTGWGTLTVPKWHVNHVMFRGIVFMNSDETIKLPLTTTKKGIDDTSEVYKAALSIMRDAVLNINTFLKKVAELGDGANDYRKLLDEQEEKITVVQMKSKVIAEVAPRVFTAPQIDPNLLAEKKDNIRIAYNVPKHFANVAKDHSDTKNFKELGEYTFNYYLKMEKLEDE